ncbi:hypothetical protein C370_07451 [Cryptococcus neoformans A1-35-8]|nr:hypothetical protein C370_07451 [Cryptococcus neoformans var. grubii A1-35-8]OXG99910.1 hypothetical protein C369_07324 [Cryptococcus neoformans var. grubii A5-35-17]
MYDGPVRGGTRGGQGDFRWSAVADDKHRENYLGHSINAPVGRWAKNKDIHWYNRDVDDGDTERAARERAEEIARVKQQEEDALAEALGLPVTKRDPDAIGTGANDVPVKKSEKDEEIERLEKEERKREKALRKEQRAMKRAEKEVKRDHKDHHRRSESRRHHRDDSERDHDRSRRHYDYERDRRYSRRDDDTREYPRRSGGGPERERDDRDRAGGRYRDRRREHTPLSNDALVKRERSSTRSPPRRDIERERPREARDHGGHGKRPVKEEPLY